MQTVTYSQVQALVVQLPVQKLPVAYRLLVDLGKSDMEASSPQQDCMLLPITERRRLMAEQAQQMVAHYKETTAERQAWQTGDFVEY